MYMYYNYIINYIWQISYIVAISDYSLATYISMDKIYGETSVHVYS